jgi:hypothetical protein
MADLDEQSLLELRKAIRSPLVIKPSQLVVSQEGLDRMKRLCADDPEFRKRVIAEFPQMEGIV